MKKETISFSFDHFKILGAFGKEIHLLGDVYTGKDQEDCLVILDKRLLKKALDICIEDKKSYCERYKHYYGLMGSIRTDNFIEYDKTKISSEYFGNGDDTEPVYKFVRTFKIKTIEHFSDMEHV